MAIIQIGGKNYVLPEMNFLAIERAWPYVVQATETLDPLTGPSAALAVFAAALMEADDFKLSDYGIPEDTTGDARIHGAVTRYLKKQLKGSELVHVKETMFDLLKEAGLEVTEGEATAALAAALETPAEEATVSLETVVDTSPSSSQPESREEAGIA